MMSATALNVPGTTVLNRSTGRLTNPASPSSAIATGLAGAAAWTRAGGGGSGSAVHSNERKSPYVTPSAAA